MTPLLALALSCLGPSPDAATLAPAIVDAVTWRASQGAAPVTDSHPLDVCLLAVYARHESGGQLHPRPWSWDARAGLSVGPWQLRPPLSDLPPRRQAIAWLRAVRLSSLGAVDSSPARAAVRLEEARQALRGAL